MQRLRCTRAPTSKIVLVYAAGTNVNRAIYAICKEIVHPLLRWWSGFIIADSLNILYIKPPIQRPNHHGKRAAGSEQPDPRLPVLFNHQSVPPQSGGMQKTQNRKPVVSDCPLDQEWLAGVEPSAISKVDHAWALSSAGSERTPHTRKVVGSIPTAPTKKVRRKKAEVRSAGRWRSVFGDVPTS